MIIHFPYLVTHQQQFIDDALIGRSRFNTVFGEEYSTTTMYQYYNAFALTSGSIHFYELFKKLIQCIKEYYQKGGRLWFQAWLNFHTPTTVLNWHNHNDSTFHGYVAINPHNTITEFREFQIPNEVGNIYLGPSSLEHRVVVVEDFQTPRITLAFDVFTEYNLLKSGKICETGNIGIYPII